MTGSMQAASPLPGYNNSVTIGTPGGSTFGFVSGSYGAVSPVSVKGQGIGAVRSTTTTFEIILQSITLTFDFFRTVRVQNTAGAFILLSAATASFTAGNTWTWTVTGPWTATSPSPRSIIFTY